MIKHYFEFITSGRGMKEIGEPEGFDAATFDIQQRLHGRDVAFAGGKSAFRIYKNSQLFYAWEDVMYELAVYGYNAEIRYHIDFHGEFTQLGEVDLGENRKTDSATYLEFQVVEQNLYTLFKKRFDMDYDILSSMTVDNTFINPAQPKPILLPSNPAKYISKWTNPTIGRETFFNNPAQNANYFNVIKNITQSDIKNTLSWLDDFNTDNEGGFTNFRVINAQDKLSNVKIQMNYNIRYDYLPTRDNDLPDHAGQILLRVYVGKSTQENEYTQYNVWSSTAFQGNTNQTENLPTSLTVDIPFVDRTSYIWISFVSATNNGAVNKVTFNECETMITATAEGYNSIIQGVRLYDAMKQVAKGVSGNNITAPRWEMGGQFYNQFLTTQNLMRNQNNKPFILSYKDISEEYLREVDGDYEMQKDGSIFYGIFEDYYINQEIAVFANAATEEFEYPAQNPDYYCNQLIYVYKNYQSQKELEEQNSGDIIHGKKQMSFSSKRTQNTKEISIGVIRDALLTEVMRRKAVELTKETATQDDDKKVLLDCINNTENRQYRETALLKHTRINDTTLVLNSVVISSVENGNETLNSGDPNFLILGIVPGTQFTIDTGINQGAYSVISVEGSEIRLQKLVVETPVVSNDGVNTTFFYIILSSNVPFIARTNQGITATNIAAPDKTVNLNYSVNRNIVNYYSQFIATQTLYEQDKTLRTRVYDNNPDAIINDLREGDDIQLFRQGVVPILTPNLIIAEIFCTLEQWKQLEATLRLNRGFIRVIDANGLPLRGYFKEGKWSADTSKPTRNSNYYGKAIITLKERYFPTRLTIQSDSGTVILNETIMPSGYSYFVDPISGKITIFDAVGKRLNIPVIFKEVTVNGVVPESIEELEDLMQNI